KFGVDFNYSNTPGKKTSVPLLPGGAALFSGLNLAALGLTGAPPLTGLQAFDPSLRTPTQRGFLSVLATILPNIVTGFPRGMPLADLPLPLTFVQGFGDPRLEVDTKYLSLFFQDDIKLKPNLLLKAGLRYDLNRVRFLPNNNGNFSPRLALSYQPSRLSSLNLHASYGLFFSVPSSLLSFVTQPFFQEQSPTKFIFLPFPLSILPYQLPGHRYPESTELPPGVRFVPQFSRVMQIEAGLRNTYAQHVSTGIDYSIGDSTTLSANYSFVRGIKIIGQRNINTVIRPVPGSPLTSQMIGRIDPTRGDIIQFESAYDSYYHGITFSFVHRFNKGINLLASYTCSKAIDNFTDPRNDIGSPSDPQRPAAERSLSLQDVRNRAVISGIYDLNLTTNRWLRDFQLSTIIRLESGRPYNLLAGVDLNMDGDTPINDRPLGLGRNVGVLPGFASVDLRLTRKISFLDHYQLQAFVEVFNLFNRVNISQIDNIFPPDGNGRFNLPAKNGDRFIAPRERFRGAFAPRQFQIGMRLSF
ncbi:MAG: TonB-dependent receptor, partial [Acidobacteriota bacterium]